MKHIYCLLMLLCLSTLYAKAQQRITGKVTDENNSPLGGVSITLNGKNTGASTSEDGRFSINVPSAKGTLVFTSVGFAKQEISISGRKSVEVQLQSEAAALNDVVVVGYGTVRKKDVTGSISTVKFNEREAAQITSVDKLLQGRAAGVDVNTGSAAPGGAVNVRIRGLSSISGGTEPLYVVDGEIVNTATQDNINSFQQHNAHPLFNAANDFLFPTDAASIKRVMLMPIPADEMNYNRLIPPSEQNFGY